MNKALLLAGAAFGGVALLSNRRESCRVAGVANKAAAAHLAATTLAEVTVPIPPSSSMRAAHDAMVKALDGRTLTVANLLNVCVTWVSAWQAGCGAKSDGWNDSPTAMDYTLWNVGSFGSAMLECIPDSCGMDQAEPGDYTQLGNALCAVQTLVRELVGGMYDVSFYVGPAPAATRDKVIRATSKLAIAMDAADYRCPGTRVSENATGTNPISWVANGVGELGGGVLGKIFGDLGDLVTVVAVVGAAVLVWQVTR